MACPISRTAGVFLSAFLIAASIVAAGDLYRPIPDNTQVTRLTRFNLRYTLRDVLADGVQRVEFYITEDMGATWRLYGEDPDRMSPMTIEVPGEGVYGFVSVATDRFGNREREPGARTPPETVIVVDRTPPAAKWLAPLEDVMGRGGPVEFRWESSDLYFGPAPVKIQFAADARSNRDRDAVWNTLQENLPAAGAYTWTPPHGAARKYNFRLVAEDRAGNITIAYNPATAHIDSTPPVITGVHPLKSAKLHVDVVVDANDGPEGSGLKYISLYTTSNNGATWTLMKERGENGEMAPMERRSGQPFPFEAPGSGNYGLWPVAFDVAQNASPLPSAGVLGDHVLVIDNEPPIVTLSNSFLNGRDTVLSNESRIVEWTAYDPHIAPNSVSILLSLDNGGTWQELASGQSNTGFASIHFPQGSQSAEAKLKAAAVDDFGNAGEGVSDAFRLSAAGTVISAISPLGASAAPGGYDAGMPPPPSGMTPFVDPYGQPPSQGFDPYSMPPPAPTPPPAEPPVQPTWMEESTATSFPRAMTGQIGPPAGAPPAASAGSGAATSFLAPIPDAAMPPASGTAPGWTPSAAPSPMPPPSGMDMAAFPAAPGGTSLPPAASDAFPPPAATSSDQGSGLSWGGDFQSSMPPSLDDWGGADTQSGGLALPPLPAVDQSAFPPLPGDEGGMANPFGGDLALPTPPTPAAPPVTAAPDPAFPAPPAGDPFGALPSPPAMAQIPPAAPAIPAPPLETPLTQRPSDLSAIPPLAGDISAPPLAAPGAGGSGRPANPRDLSNHYANESKGYLDEGRVDLALESATKALNEDDTNPLAYSSLAQAYVAQEPPNYARAATLAKEATNLGRDWYSWWTCADVFYRWAHARNTAIQAQIQAGQRPPADMVDERNQALSNAQIAIGNSVILSQGGAEADREKVALTQGEIVYLRALTIPEPQKPPEDDAMATAEYRRAFAAYRNAVTPILQESLPYFQTAIGFGGAPSYREAFRLGIVNFRLGGLERESGNAQQATMYYDAAAKHLEDATVGKDVPPEGPREAYYMLAYCHDQLAGQPGRDRARHKELALRYWRQTAGFYPPGTSYRDYAEQRMTALSDELGR